MSESPDNTRVSDMTVTELLRLIRSAVQAALTAERESPPRSQMALVELEPLHVGAWPDDDPLLSREAYYDDER